MERVLEFLKENPIYMLATMDGDQPRVRPFGTVDIFEDKLYIQTGLSKDVAKQMRKNGKVELCAFDGQQWLRLAATAVWEDSVPAQEHMLQNYPQLRAMYTPGDGNSAVFRLKDATATFASFTAPPRTVTF